MLHAVQPTCLLIADISGYTGYLADVELDHAHDVLADLVGAVVSALGPSFALAKLEGDAAFLTMPAESLDGSMLLDTVERCYFGFRRRRRDIRQATACECRACARIPDLNLKFVVHHGPVMHQRMAGSDELLGSDVIVVHRLLKNHVVDGLGMSAYALVSQSCVDAAGLEPAALGMQPCNEEYESIGEVRAWAHDLEQRWQEEERRVRSFVDPAGAVIDLAIPAPVPPQVAWEFLTTPGLRQTWQPGVTEVIVSGATGGRRGPGATNHCMHGKDAVLEEIVDWRPYDYLTDRTVLATPIGPVRLLHTIELEPTPAGTTVHIRFAPPEDAREREAAAPIAADYGPALAAAAPKLAAGMRELLARRRSDPSATVAAPPTR